ncbi:hypothetical protein KA005_39360, partial [bacterium]|nr:hypothetical protein [bacterium]
YPHATAYSSDKKGYLRCQRGFGPDGDREHDGQDKEQNSHRDGTMTTRHCCLLLSMDRVRRACARGTLKNQTAMNILISPTN